jgi:2,3-bisphosphoglycerate-independent phosphoglycerate mutase
MLEPGVCEIGSVSGRLYLDRKKTWERTEQIYNALVLGKSDYEAKDFESAIEAAYKRGESDEFISPTIIRNSAVTATDNISDGDSIIFYNLRSDRARQFTKPFVQEQFEHANQDPFRRAKILKNIRFVAMTDFGPDLGPVLTAYPSRDVHQSLPMVLKKHYRQLYISETEKYAHITYFLNGGYTEPVAGEHRILVRSKDVRSYKDAPEMSAKEITSVVLEVLREKWYNFICINFPNADMVGHTGDIKAAVITCQTIDHSIRDILQEVEKQNGEAVIIADHGNAENMGEEVGENNERVINTMHEKNPVPFIIYTKKKIALKGQDSDESSCKLADIAPTILALEDIPKPKDMTGESLII